MASQYVQYEHFNPFETTSMEINCNTRQILLLILQLNSNTVMTIILYMLTVFVRDHSQTTLLEGGGGAFREKHAQIWLKPGGLGCPDFI